MDFKSIEDLNMESLKEEAITAISKLPDSADMDEIMYQLYLLDKVMKGQEAIERGETITAVELKSEIQSW